MTSRRRPFVRDFCAPLVLALLLVLLPASRSPAASEWQVIKVGKWDYLSVDNIAKFYGFVGDLTLINKTIRLDNGRNQLEVTLDSREAIVNGVRNWFCFPVIAHTDGKLLVSRIDLAKTIEPQFRSHLIKNLGRIKTVVLDPGHGGTEKGAISTYGNEKDFSLDVALKLRPLLQAKGFNVVMTREKDELVPLHERARIANATRDSIFVSIHFNATDANPAATGFEIYSLTPRGAPSTQDNSLLERFSNMQAGSPVDAPSLVLSTSVYHAMLGHMPEFDRGVKRARFAVLRLTNIPAILVEGGFMSEREESRLIAAGGWRAKLAQAISVGLESYRGLVEKKQRPMVLADYRRQIDGVLVARNPNAPAPGSILVPPILPASHRSTAPDAQLTVALRREPSAPQPVEVAVSEPQSSASAPAEIGDAIAQEELFEDAAKIAGTEQASPAPEDESMPDAVAPGEGEQAQVSAASVLPNASPVAQVVRKYWVLKFDPPPKFRQ